METAFQPNSRQYSEGSPHMISIQDLLDYGKPTPTTLKELHDREMKVYRPTIGFYGNVYLTDDFGNLIQIPSKRIGVIRYFIFGTFGASTQWILSASSSTPS